VEGIRAMSRSYAHVFILIIIVALSIFPILAEADYEVHPSVDTKDFITYTTTQGNVTVNQVAPKTFKIQWSGEYDIVVNGWLCWQFWDPSCDPANYKYEVTDKNYRVEVTLPQILEYNGARILLTYFTSISAVPYATKTWYGYLEEHIKVVLSVYAYGTVDLPPTTPGGIDLGSIISSKIGNWYIPVWFNIVARRTSPSTDNKVASGYFRLLLDGLKVSFYRLRVESISPTVSSTKPLGRFDPDGYIGIGPVGSILVKLCLDGDSGYRLDGTVSYMSSYDLYEAPVSIASGTCSSVTINNVPLTPGNYTGERKFTVAFKSGVISINMYADAEVKGTMGIVSTPFVALMPGDDGTNVTVYMGVNYANYKDNSNFIVSARGTIYIDTRNGNKISRNFVCNSVPFTASGTYECTVNIGNIGIKPLDVVGATADVSVTVSLGTTRFSDKITVRCAVISPSSVHGLVASIYNALTRGAFIVMLGLLILYVLNYVANFFGNPLFDHGTLAQGLMTSVVLATMIFVIPYFYWVVLSLIYAMPEFRDVLGRTAISDPNQLLSMPPDRAIAVLMNYYDMTLNQLKIDYKTWFESQLITHVFARLATVGVIIGILLGIALLLIITHNSTTIGALVSPTLGYMSMVIGMMMMLTPLVAVVSTLLAITELVITVTAAVFMIVFMFGLLVAMIPSPISTRLAEDFLGGSIYYMLAIPSFGPIIYAVFMHVRNTLDFYIKQLEASLPHLNLGITNVTIDIVVPVTPLMRMIGYITIASLTLLMISLLHGYLLSRTGVMTGLGEAILKVGRR